MVWSRVNAQEEVPIDIVTPDVIIDTPAPELEQPVDTVGTDTPIDIPPLEGGIVVDVARDVDRLAIKAFQMIAMEDTGEYIQVGLNKEFVDGDIATFQSIAVDDVKTNYEIHVYDAPCGRGWQLIVHDDSVLVESRQFNDKGQQVSAYVPLVRSYGYGCESASRTENW